MIGGDFRADIEQTIFRHAEFGDESLGLDFGLAEVAALRLGDILCLGRASAELNRDIAVTVLFAARHDLDILKHQNGNRHVPAIILEQAGHPHLLSDHASAHDPFLPNRGSR
jgi:hypothetical protein